MLTFWMIFAAFIILIIVLAVIYGFFLWIKRRQFTRERFAFVALGAIIAMTTLVIISLTKNLLPWEAGAILINHIFKTNIIIDKPSVVDYGFLISVYIIGSYSILQLHKNWNGLVSIDQYRRVQRSEPTGLVTEGVIEVFRIVTRRPSFEIYTKTDPRDILSKLEPVTDSLAWKDQARELIRLSSSSYAFDADRGWHDLTSLWVGENLKTGELVLIHPIAERMNQEAVIAIIASAMEIAKLKNMSIDILIIALRGNDLLPDASLNYPIKIRFVNESQLLDALVNWNDYFAEIKKRLAVNHLPDSDLTLQDVYVPSMCDKEDGTSSGIDVQALFEEWSIENSQKQLSLLGGYGQGKSTTALIFTYNMLCKRHDGGRIPLLIELRGTSPRNLTPLQMLGAWSSQYNINPLALLRLHIAGRLILIFEGFDEMALIGDAEMRLKHFRTLWQFCYPRSKIIITGRPNFFLDEIEMKSALGIYQPSSGNAYCEALRLLPFDLEQIRTSLRAHPSYIREQICSLVNQNPRFKELVSRPSLLHIVSVLWERENLSSKVDKLDSAYIMELFVRHSYRRQGRKEADSPDFMALNGAEREYFMQGIAAYMSSQLLPNQISASQLGDLVESLILVAPDSLSTEVSTISGEVRRPLRERLVTAEHGVDHVKTDVRACGLLVDDPAAPGTFRFGHKSFMEYLFAAVLADCINNRSEKSRAILKATNASITDLRMLPVSIDFLAEMLSVDPHEEAASNIGKASYPDEVAARRLLEAVLGGSEMAVRIKRIVLFVDCCFRTIFSHVLKRSPGSRLIHMLIFCASSSLLALIGLVLMFLKKGGVEANGLSGASSVVFGFMIAFQLTAMTSLSLSSQMGLWNLLCKSMGISDRVMHRVIGTWFLPWACKKTFNYYLSENRDLEYSQPFNDPLMSNMANTDRERNFD